MDMKNSSSLLFMIAAVGIFLTGGLASAGDATQANASSFIDSLGKNAIEKIADKSIPKKTREESFGKLFREAFAVKGIAKFALGRYWRQATAEQQTRYLATFERYIVQTYARRFESYSNQTFTVRGERDEGKKGVFVIMNVQEQGKPPIKIEWRVKKSRKTGRFRIIDVIIENVSMSLTQRSDFSTTLQRQGGNIDKFLELLEAKLAPSG